MTNSELILLSQEAGKEQGIASMGERVTYHNGYQAGFRKALELVFKDLLHPVDLEMLEEDQLPYHILEVEKKYKDLPK